MGSSMVRRAFVYISDVSLNVVNYFTAMHFIMANHTPNAP